MDAFVLTHVREGAGGAVVVTPLPFAELACEAATVADAVAQLEPVLVERLVALEPVDRLPFREHPRGEIVRCPVSVPVGGKDGEPIEIQAGLVVEERTLRGRPVLIAFAPVLPGFQLVRSDGDRDLLVTSASAALVKRVRSWSAAAILAADEPDDSRLDVIRLTVPAGPAGDEDAEPRPPARRGILEELGVELPRREGGRIDLREELVARVLEAFSYRGRSSVLLVGSPDVGKTALIHEIARRLAAGEVPEALRGRKLWRISANELIAGAQYTGMWQDRVRRLVEQARATGAICVMGDPIGLIDAGRWSGSDNNASRFLRPYVEEGDLTLVFECTPEQLAAAERKEPSFIAAFHRITVAEPSPDEARAIAAVAAARLAEAAGIEVTDDAVDAAVELTGRFEPYRGFPGKGIRLLEESLQRRGEETTVIDRSVVTAEFARRTGMRLALLSDAAPLHRAEIRRHFESRVLGQPEATDAMVDLVTVLKAGLNDRSKPLGSFFFVGPTGVGKTELAKALAEFLFGSRDRLVRFDMGEYATQDAVQRLIGTTWGSREGALTARVREQPFCVLLLDEIEKAHWSVFDVLLAALGEGRLSDAAGRTADFRNTIVIMTSNLGATRVRASSLGFGPGAPDVSQELERRYVEEAERFFRPEFFNRIDRIVVFHALTRQIVTQIVRRDLDQLLLREGISRRGLRVEIDDAAVDQLAAKGFHPKYGARPLQREIEQAVIRPLAQLLVERRPGPDDFARIHRGDGAVTVTLERITEAAAPRTTRRERHPEQDVANFAKAEKAVAAFVAQLPGDPATALAEKLRPSLSELISTTHEPTFWDDTDRARSTLQRIYRLEQALDRLDSLRTRAEGLADMARRVREARDRGRLREIQGALTQMEESLVVARLELAAAVVASDGGGARIRVIPIGAPAREWAAQLRAMYRAWAERTARDWTDLGDAEASLSIEGLATVDLLAGESGLHRHVLPDRTEVVARVVIDILDQPLGAAEEDAGTIVRVYDESKRRVVRDPRTGARESHVAAVLEEGRIDAFLLAWLMRGAPA